MKKALIKAKSLKQLIQIETKINAKRFALTSEIMIDFDYANINLKY